MDAVALQLDARLSDLLTLQGRPLEEVVPELLVLELYRRGQISSGKAADLLDMERIAFIHYASRLGLPFFDLSETEWRKEVDDLDDL